MVVAIVSDSQRRSFRRIARISTHQRRIRRPGQLKLGQLVYETQTVELLEALPQRL